MHLSLTKSTQGSKNQMHICYLHNRLKYHSLFNFLQLGAREQMRY